MTTEADLLAMLARRYRPPEWALFRHVADATGAVRARTADAVAMNCWPSGGLEVVGFEAKTTKADLARELRDPEKWDAVGRYCDRFWLVLPWASPSTDTDLDVPEEWGVMRGYRVVRPAPLLTPLPLSREFVAALLRAASRGSLAATH